eukprot:TRINITY_DN1486_c0_g1_i11.p1 TRINITY_DN1486_c0_g1~~TRINITY_DN1486_c0_g1_i11.p1  ORF type:complete len:427 (-),score=57.06 TRINITY_DN1486_c0_g1_i11:712-1968(-)
MAVAWRRVRIRSGVALFNRLLLCNAEQPRLTSFYAVRQPLLPMFWGASPTRSFSSDLFPPHEFLSMPALSPTMNKGNVIRWRKKEGDELAAGDVLCEIETDKASVDFETVEEGFLAKILVSAGSKDISVGSPLCIVVEHSKDVQIFSSRNVLNTSPKDEHSSSTVRSSHKMSPSLDKIGPSVRRLLAETGLIKSKLQSTGPRGLLVKGDVLAAQRAEKRTHSAMEVGIGASREAPTLSSSTFEQPASAPVYSFDQVATSQIRKIIAKRLSESKTNIPHFYLNLDAILDPTLAIRKQLMDEHGIKLSLNDFIIRAAALALKAVPEVNAFWDVSVQGVVPNSSIDIAIAVSTEKGLVTPVVRHADLKSLSLISAEVKLSSEKARMGKLAPDEFEGGTFSISNLGMRAVNHFSAIINPPQV